MQFVVTVAVFVSLCGFLLVPYVVFAKVVINEVLFNPAGTDTTRSHLLTLIG